MSRCCGNDLFRAFSAWTFVGTYTWAVGPGYYISRLRRLRSQPRSGEKSVAHGASRGIASNKDFSRRAAKEMFRPSGAEHVFRFRVPWLTAMGYRSSAAPRLRPKQDLPLRG